jgi:hypothetical protein
VFAPAGTPRDIVMKLNGEIGKALAAPTCASASTTWAGGQGQLAEEFGAFCSRKWAAGKRCWEQEALKPRLTGHDAGNRRDAEAHPQGPQHDLCGPRGALRVSTPTVKRLFSQRNLHPGALEEILKVLEMDFFELRA